MSVHCLPLPSAPYFRPLRHGRVTLSNHDVAPTSLGRNILKLARSSTFRTFFQTVYVLASWVKKMISHLLSPIWRTKKRRHFVLNWMVFPSFYYYTLVNSCSITLSKIFNRQLGKLACNCVSLRLNCSNCIMSVHCLPLPSAPYFRPLRHGRVTLSNHDVAPTSLGRNILKLARSSTFRTFFQTVYVLASFLPYPTHPCMWFYLISRPIL